MILLEQIQSPQGEQYVFSLKNPKNFLFWRAGRCPAPTVPVQTAFFGSMKRTSPEVRFFS
jgi:hypothetical protein